MTSYVVKQKHAYSTGPYLRREQKQLHPIYLKPALESRSQKKKRSTLSHYLLPRHTPRSTQQTRKFQDFYFLSVGTLNGESPFSEGIKISLHVTLVATATSSTSEPTRNCQNCNKKHQTPIISITVPKSVATIWTISFCTPGPP